MYNYLYYFLYQPLSQFEIVLGHSNIYLTSYFSFYSFIVDNINTMEKFTYFIAKYVNFSFVYYTLKYYIIISFKYIIHFILSIISFTFIFDFSTQLFGPSNNSKDFLSLIDFKQENSSSFHIASLLLNIKKSLLNFYLPHKFPNSFETIVADLKKLNISEYAKRAEDLAELRSSQSSEDFQLEMECRKNCEGLRLQPNYIYFLSHIFKFFFYLIVEIFSLNYSNLISLLYVFTLLVFLKIFQFLIYFFNSEVFSQYTNYSVFYINHPFYQINKYVSYYFVDYSITKFHTTIFFILFFFFIFFVLNLKKEFFFRPSVNFIIFGLIDKFLTNTIVQQLGIKRGQEFSVVLKTFFFLILFANLFGLIPFSFTITSHLVFTFGLSFAIIATITIFGFYKQGFKFLNLLIPGGAPKALLPILIPIELLSYIVRCFSLAIRLFANMMSGHSLLYILSGFVIQITAAGFFLIALAPFFIVLLIGILEIGVAMLQAYVFLVLTCIYLRDGYQAGH